MTSHTISLVTFVAALGCALIGGVFFAFSSFVLPALARLPQPLGLYAMQSINVTVLCRSFLSAFLGTALLCAALVVDALWHWSAPHAGLRLGGALLYLFGGLWVTKALNVPWNRALAAIQPCAANATRHWLEFVAGWRLWNHVRTVASIAAAALLTLAATGCSRYWQCAPPDQTREAGLPERLSQTGLYEQGDPNQLSPGVRAFAPQFALWSDGALKRRWIRIPAGERIDTSDMNNWLFPVGTQLWKEFNVDGQRVETRMLRKISTGADAEAWIARAYVWLPDGSDAVATPKGASNVLGTAHDVPSAGECLACHGGRKSFALGFSAVQLAYAAPSEQLDLQDLVKAELVTRAPFDLTLPGTETDRRALGYLHANCGHCHNQDRPAAAASRCYNPENELDFWLRAERLRSVTDTPSYQAGRGLAFDPGNPDNSRMVELMSDRGFLRQMPPLGTQIVDAYGVSAVRNWIAALR